MRRGTTRVDDAFGNPLVVEVGDFLAEMEVLQQGRAPLTGLQRVIGIRHPNSLGGGQELPALSHGLGPILGG